MMAEIDIAGVYLSSSVATALAAFAVTLLLRRLIGWTGAYRHIWHPALFDAALFVLLWAAVADLPLSV